MFTTGNPYKMREIYTRGIEWKPSRDSLPMRLSVEPNAVAYTSGVLVMIMLAIGVLASLGLFLIGALYWDVGSIFLGLVLFAVCGYYLYATVIKIRTNEKLELTSDAVSLDSKTPFSSESWTEPLSNYFDITVHYNQGAAGSIPQSWSVVLRHPNKDRSVLLAKFFHRDKAFESFLQRCPELFGKHVVDKSPGSRNEYTPND